MTSNVKSALNRFPEDSTQTQTAVSRPRAVDTNVSNLVRKIIFPVQTDVDRATLQRLKGRKWDFIDFPDGAHYIGDVYNGQMDGQGSFIDVSKTYRYVGGFCMGKFHGQGTLRINNGGAYCGEFKYSKYHGKGVLQYEGGNVYEGDFFEGVAHGQGILRFPNGMTISGDFNAGFAHGHIKVKYPNGFEFIGECSEGSYIQGAVFNNENRLIYSGQLYKDCYHGLGKLFLNEGEVYEGGFFQGKFHGSGTYTQNIV